MTRFEKIKQMSLEELGDLICDHYADQEACDECIASDLCRQKHRGTYEWLKEEI